MQHLIEEFLRSNSQFLNACSQMLTHRVHSRNHMSSLQRWMIIAHQISQCFAFSGSPSNDFMASAVSSWTAFPKFISSLFQFVVRKELTIPSTSSLTEDITDDATSIKLNLEPTVLHTALTHPAVPRSSLTTFPPQLLPLHSSLTSAKAYVSCR